MDSITKSLTIEEILLFYVPNSFTPDGDEYNNVFTPIMTAGIDLTDYSLEFSTAGESRYLNLKMPHKAGKESMEER